MQIIRSFINKYKLAKTSSVNSRIVNSVADVTIILTVWKRNNVEEQIKALYGQINPSFIIWIYKCGNYVDLSEIRRKYPEVHILESSINLKYFGRFSLAQYVETTYTWIIDDDVIPSVKWLTTIKTICESTDCIVSSAGRIIPYKNFKPEQTPITTDRFIGDSSLELTYNFCLEDTLVDFGCNSWFFKSNWIKYFWQIPPLTLSTGEDIHFSAVSRIMANIKTIVPKQSDLIICGNLKKWYGQDSFATWQEPGFLEEREKIITNLIYKYNWKPLSW